MNRDIKFRGKSKQGKWVYGSLVIAKHDGNPVSFIYTPQYDITELHECSTDGEGKVSLESQVVPVLTDTVGQDTGLKDKNGTEIYEGDILEFEYHSHNSWHNVREQVGFALGIFHIWGSPLTDYNGITVIGNIYEHPELLKETSQ